MITFTTTCMRLSVVIQMVLLRTNATLFDASASSTFMRRMAMYYSVCGRVCEQDEVSLYLVSIWMKSRLYIHNLWVMRELLCATRSSPDFLTSSFTAPRLNWLLKLAVWKGACRIALVE